MKLTSRDIEAWPVSARIGLRTGPRAPTGCREWMGALDTCGYAHISVGGRNFKVSRLILGLTDSKVCAIHVCDNPACVEPSHLRAGTQQDNVRDMDAKRRRPTRLTDESVREIRRRLAAGEKQCAIAAALGVHFSTVSTVKMGRRWAALKGEAP